LRKEREMTTRKKTTTGKTPVKKLKLKRETIKDLDVKGKGAGLKGGRMNKTETSCWVGPAGTLC
jgi:hypothetical protein